MLTGLTQPRSILTATERPRSEISRTSWQSPSSMIKRPVMLRKGPSAISTKSPSLRNGHGCNSLSVAITRRRFWS